MFLISVWDLLITAFTVHISTTILYMIIYILHKDSFLYSSPLFFLDLTRTAFICLHTALAAFSSMHLKRLPDSTDYPIPNLLLHF